MNLSPFLIKFSIWQNPDDKSSRKILIIWSFLCCYSIGWNYSIQPHTWISFRINYWWFTIISQRIKTPGLIIAWFIRSVQRRPLVRWNIKLNASLNKYWYSHNCSCPQYIEWENITLLQHQYYIFLPSNASVRLAQYWFIDGRMATPQTQRMSLLTWLMKINPLSTFSD